MVAAAVELAGGPAAVGRLCGVARQSVYVWIAEGKVPGLVDGIRLSRASGVPVEKLAGDELLEPATVNRQKARKGLEPKDRSPQDGSDKDSIR